MKKMNKEICNKCKRKMCLTELDGSKRFDCSYSPNENVSCVVTVSKWFKGEDYDKIEFNDNCIYRLEHQISEWNEK